jgi:hypothetical protein
VNAHQRPFTFKFVVTHAHLNLAKAPHSFRQQVCTERA